MVAITYFDRRNEQNSTDIGKKGGQNLGSRDLTVERVSRDKLLFWKPMDGCRTRNMPSGAGRRDKLCFSYSLSCVLVAQAVRCVFHSGREDYLWCRCRMFDRSFRAGPKRRVRRKYSLPTQGNREVNLTTQGVRTGKVAPSVLNM